MKNYLISLKLLFRTILIWFDNQHAKSAPETKRIEWLRVLPFIGIHVACLFVLVVGFSWIALATAIFLYAIRIFAIGAFYHRYFSHRTFKTSRMTQFIFACIAASSAQRGPLWWAAHHRTHHTYSDQPEDVHSPVQQGFWYSHMGWFLYNTNFHYDAQRIRDWSLYRELRFIDRFDTLAPCILALLTFFWGMWLEQFPALGTDRWQMLIWGFFISTVAVFHATFSINSLAHQWGTRRFETSDQSRNNFLLALLTFGEGWHNNHHHDPKATRQGLMWWEIDFTYYLLKLMEKFKLISDIKSPKSME